MVSKKVNSDLDTWKFGTWKGPETAHCFKKQTYAILDLDFIAIFNNVENMSNIFELKVVSSIVQLLLRFIKLIYKTK